MPGKGGWCVSNLHRQLPVAKLISRPQLKGSLVPHLQDGSPAHTLVVPNSPSFIIVKVNISFSVGLGEESMGQDAPRPIEWQVVPMPVPGGRGGEEHS